MQWLVANWFWVLIFIAFIAMHLFGHGGHGGDDGQRSKDEKGKDKTPSRVVNTSGHQH